MAAGDRKNGKPTDVVRHFATTTKTLCGRLKFGYATDDKSDVTCLSCLKKLNQNPK